MRSANAIGSVHTLFADDEFHGRHIGPSDAEQAAMLAALGVASRHDLIAQTVPASIRLTSEPDLPAPATESAALAELAAIAGRNQLWRSWIGAGYHGTITPEPIRRNVLENPGWYTAYTPYQAEVAQGRLESLLEGGAVQEVLLATNPTVEGEATAHFLSELVGARGLRATRIAHGVPIGGELEYIDGGTLAHALAGRHTLGR